LQEKRQEGMHAKKFSHEALQALQQYDWPGNLPELESLVLRSAAMKKGDLLLPEDLIFNFQQPPARRPLRGEEGESWFDAAIPTLAHEIKNPLVAISTFAHLLPEKYDDPEFRGEFSGLVMQDVRRINELLENLLEFAQFAPPRFTANDLNFILEEILQQEEKTLGRRGGEIRTELGEELPLVLFDQAQLNFVLRNLLENVVAKMGSNQPLHVSTRFSREEGREGQKQFVDLHMWRDGQERVFSPLPQSLHEGSKPDFQNQNLALLLIRKVMVRNRGQMQVGQEEEEGMTVRLRFPVAERTGMK